MKKIFIILSVLFIGLLFSCASKPANSSFEQKQIRPTVEPAQIDVDDEVWTKFSYFDMVNNLGGIPDDLIKINSLQHPIRPAVKNKFFDISNSSEISGYDFWVLIAICKWSKNDCSRNELELYGESKQWAEEFLNDKNITDKKNFTVKIINKTNEVLPANAVIEVGRAGENKLFDLTVPANSEKYFTFPSELLEGHIPNVFLPEWNTWGMNYMGTDFCQYIINNYSLEIVYDKDLIYFEEKDDDKDGVHRESYLCESWKFVPRYKNEENIIKNIPWGKPKNPNSK